MTPAYYNARWRVGHLYPSGGLSDYELQRMAPAALQFIVTRMPFRSTGLESDLQLVADLETHAALAADAGVDLIAFNCTAASLLVGPAKINARIKAATGIEGITTIEAVIEALHQFQAKRLALFTPYPAEVVKEEIHFLAKAGFRVVSQAHFPCETPSQQGQLDPAIWLDLLAQTDLGNADAILFSCAGICLSPIISKIEAETGLPVITSNAALLNSILNRLNIAERPVGFGRLLSGLGGTGPE